MRKSLFLLSLFVLAYSSNVWSQHKLKPSGQIPILAWIGVPQEETTVARYQEMRESGININFSSYTNVEAMAKALKIAQKTGVKMIISCPELKSDPEKTVKLFMHHPAVAGYFLRDEPGRKDFKELSDWAKRIQSIDDKHYCYLNLLPNYANEDQLGVKTYREYVNTFIKEVPLQLLSFDHYPVIGETSESIRELWYENLEIFSDEAAKANKPFWAFALTVSHGPYPIPTLAMLRLQVYSDLAYGAQGIQYFTYWTPKDTQWNFHNGPITLESKRSEVYDKIKVMNGEIQKLAPVFLGAKLVSVAHTGKNIPVGTKRLLELPKPIQVLETEGLGAVVSVLEKGPDSFLVVVNRDMVKTMKLTIKGDSTLDKVLKDGSLVPADTYMSTIVVEPGDVAIYRWPKI
jgi:hypothetical protein